MSLPKAEFESAVKWQPAVTSVQADDYGITFENMPYPITSNTLEFILHRYEISLGHVVEHADRGATVQEVRDAEKELDWLNANEAHLENAEAWWKAQFQK